MYTYIHNKMDIDSYINDNIDDIIDSCKDNILNRKQKLNYIKIL